MTYGSSDGKDCPGNRLFVLSRSIISYLSECIDCKKRVTTLVLFYVDDYLLQVRVPAGFNEIF